MKVTIPIKLQFLATAAVLAATAAVGGSAVVDPATACAAPDTVTWDEDYYRSCIALGKQPAQDCCWYAGGEWKRDTDGYLRCVRPAGGAGPAPAATAPPEPESTLGPRAPTATPPQDVATLPPPPPPFTTFAPVPANPG